MQLASYSEIFIISSSSSSLPLMSFEPLKRCSYFANIQEKCRKLQTKDSKLKVRWKHEFPKKKKMKKQWRRCLTKNSFVFCIQLKSTHNFRCFSTFARYFARNDGSVCDSPRQTLIQAIAIELLFPSFSSIFFPTNEKMAKKFPKWKLFHLKLKYGNETSLSKLKTAQSQSVFFVRRGIESN